MSSGFSNSLILLGSRCSLWRLIAVGLAGGLLVLQQAGAPLRLQQACICAQLLLLLCVSAI
jgi:hypothetical protein